MANTVHGPFVPGASTSTGSYGTGVGQVNTYTSGNANNDETQAGVALFSVNPDLLTPFVLSGITCTKDGVTASQLDVASGYAYLTQSDNTLARCDVGATTFSTTGNPSTTMYLDLNPDGSWSWATTHSAVSHHLTICSVTTDGSANIATVTDARNLFTTVLSGAATNGAFVLRTLNSDGGALFSDGAGNLTSNGAFKSGVYAGTSQYTYYAPLASGAEGEHVFQVWNGSATVAAFGIGNGAGVPTYITPTGAVGAVAGQATAGSLGVPVIVAQALDVHVTTIGDQTILTYTTATQGLYEVSGYAYFGNGSPEAVTFRTVWTDPHGGTPTAYFIINSSGQAGTILSGSETPIGINQSLSLMPITIEASSGTNILVHWNDPAGTPNDYVSVLIKRLS